MCRGAGSEVEGLHLPHKNLTFDRNSQCVLRVPYITVSNSLICCCVAFEVYVYQLNTVKILRIRKSPCILYRTIAH